MEPKLHSRQSGGVKESTSSTTELYKISSLPLYYDHISKACKLRNTKFNDKAILDGTVIMYDIFGREWLSDTESK